MFCADLFHSLFAHIQRKVFFPLLGLVNNCQNKVGLEAAEETVIKNVKITVRPRSVLILNNSLEAEVQSYSYIWVS